MAIVGWAGAKLQPGIAYGAWIVHRDQQCAGGCKLDGANGIVMEQLTTNGGWMSITVAGVVKTL